MKNQFFFLWVIILLTSCSGNSVDAILTTDSTHLDTMAMIPSQGDIDPALVGKFVVTTPLPFVTDSIYFVTRYENRDTTLTREEVKYLSFDFLETDFSYSGIYHCDDFYLIDSLKTADAYTDYIETIDIGMTASSDAYAIQKIKIDDNTSLLVWCIRYASYAACPYSSGTILYASVLYTNSVTSCTVIGEDTGGADAPYWSTTLTLSGFSKSAYKINTFDKSGGEEDVDGKEIIRSKNTEYELKIVGGKWVLAESDLATNS